MKPVSGPLAALLATRVYNAAQLYQWTLADGTIMRHTDYDQDLSWGGFTWTCGGQTGPYYGSNTTVDQNAGSNVNNGQATWSTGLTVDDAVFDVRPGQGLVRGVSWQRAITYGFFDGATFKRYLAYLPIGSVVVTGVLLMVSGRVGDIQGGRELPTFTIKAMTELLNIPMPRELYQVTCNNILYGTGCALNRASFAVNGTVAAGTTAGAIKATIAGAPGYYNLGSLKLTSGVGAGLVRSVKTWISAAPGTLTLMGPFPVIPQPGDTFTVYPGCDLTQNTCLTKFNNLANLRSMPFIPEATTAI
jgi:uncharacterized phage protein (TIGR02218 family)